MRSSHPLHVWVLILVGLGGAVGAVARYALGELFPDNASGFPWTTFAINVTGSLLLAGLPALSVVRRHHHLPPFLGTGVLGGYTTLSTYSEQARALLTDGSVVTAVVYVVGTLAACLVAVAIADRVINPQARHQFEDEEGDL